MRKWVWILGLFSSLGYSTEYDLSGVVDVRASYTDGIDSYVGGGLGKFRFDPEFQLSLSQLGLAYKVDWDNALSARVVANGYVDGIENNIGITEAYLEYKGLPFSNGVRFSGKAGLMYPNISLENIATAWSSPYTLSYSTINSWLAEEVRHTGIRLTVDLLGKFHQSNHDFKINTDIFANNDTAGAMLAWHGWTQSSRQTLLQEKLTIPDIPAINGGMLAEQAKASDPFIELDDRLGYHLSADWKIKGKGLIQAGYYDNNANTRIVKNGQYTWLTQFSHIGVKWKLPNQFELISQYLQGDTLMNSPLGDAAVSNHYHSGFVMLSRRWDDHRLSFRLEDFEVDDNDLTPEDNNDETGQSYTLSYRFQWRKGWFLHAEYNRIESSRYARSYLNEPVDLVEQQWQLASRFYF